MNKIRYIILIFVLSGCVQHSQENMKGNIYLKQYQGGPAGTSIPV